MTMIKEGYRETEFGVLPEDWSFTSLEKISEFITKGATPTTYGYEWQDEGIYFFKSDCVKNGRFVYGDYKFISKEAHNSMERSKVTYGDILLSITGNIGKVCRVPPEIKEANINQHIARIRINNSGIDSEFVFQWLCRERSEKNYYLIKTGQAYPQISLKQVRDTVIPVPSLGEQRRIADILSRTDDHLEKLDEIIGDYQILKKGVIKKLLTVGIGHSEFKDTEAGTVPLAWEVKELSSCFNFYSGHSIPRDKLTGDGSYYVHYGDIHTRKKTYISTFEDSHWLPRTQIPRLKEGTLLESGDIVFADASEDYDGVGKSIVIFNNGENIVAGLHTIVAKEKEKVFYDQYKRYFMQSQNVKYQLKKLAAGAKVYGISKGNLGKVLVPVPSIKEQQVIANVLSSIDERIDSFENQKTEYIQLKKALMEQLFTGRIRVNNLEV